MGVPNIKQVIDKVQVGNLVGGKIFQADEINLLTHTEINPVYMYYIIIVIFDVVCGKST